MSVLMGKLKFMRNFRIGTKLTLGLAVLVLLTLLVVLLSFVGDVRATEKINMTDEVRAPAALAASRAQVGLLKMLGDVRGYLALGEASYRTSYDTSEAEFQKNFGELRSLLSTTDSEVKNRVRLLDEAIGQWSQLPAKMFELRDDQLAREPGYRQLVTVVDPLADSILADSARLIQTQGDLPPSSANNVLLVNMAQFQNSFAATLSGLRAYITTRDRSFKNEYLASLRVNDDDWQRLAGARDTLEPGQQALLTRVEGRRDSFLKESERAIQRLEGPDWRLDLFWFKTVAVPRANTMVSLLGEMTDDQQALLRQDLNQGRGELHAARRQTLIGGVLAVVIGISLALVLGSNIAGPVRRLTVVADRIRAGDLQAEARVESGDEIGVLARTFNNMTGQLRRTLAEVTRQKKRADDLLDVVIPIGVSLASQKDFNRLLEDMLIQAKSFCRADAGTLYLISEDRRLQHVIVRNDRLGLAIGGATGEPIRHEPLPLDEAAARCSLAARVALSGVSSNVPDAAQASELQACGPEHQDRGGGDFVPTSVLTIPLKGSEAEVLGVLQLFDARDAQGGTIVAFDENLQRMMESFSSLAVAALEAYIREQRLQQQIQQLRIEIDEVKRQRQVNEIVDTDFFQDLQEKARLARDRRRLQAGGAEARG